ncbi:MAG TPA: PD-(D/E)XK nuclease family protein, partial [Ginsengibacter sp.]|nr:PD-(D/E)XK nuclease family protein [Ginsengibacter sp.]
SSGRDGYRKFLPALIHHVLHAVIPANSHPFSLKDVKSSQRARELEFDFSINQLQPATIRKYGLEVMNKIIRLRTDFTMKGMMNGFIDLFFEHEGRYYVLDWKTNFLGNRVSHYTGESLEQAMDEWNYHLQYLIYTLAVKKYLKQRLGTFDYKTFGGVIYCFVRGMRAGKNSGIYCYRPQEKDLELLESVIK